MRYYQKVWNIKLVTYRSNLRMCIYLLRYKTWFSKHRIDENNIYRDLITISIWKCNDQNWCQQAVIATNMPWFLSSFSSSYWIVYCFKKMFAMHLLCLRYIHTTKTTKTITVHLVNKRKQTIFIEKRLPDSPKILSYPLLSL